MGSDCNLITKHSFFHLITLTTEQEAMAHEFMAHEFIRGDVEKDAQSYSHG
jgi:hypothetical protein